jgi:catechol 2,3-dioxygenase
MTKIINMSYTVPTQTRIGHVHLKVSDLNKALSFYHDLLGFEITQRYGPGAVFISAGGYHHHIGLNTWHSKNAAPAPVNTCGLYHTAILYPTRKDLAVILKRLVDAQYQITGAADHGVSEAIYLNDPDRNGVELYWDKPREQWPFDADGNVAMVTEALDIESLLSELDN